MRRSRKGLGRGYRLEAAPLGHPSTEITTKGWCPSIQPWQGHNLATRERAGVVVETTLRPVLMVATISASETRESGSAHRLRTPHTPLCFGPAPLSVWKESSRSPTQSQAQQLLWTSPLVLKVSLLTGSFTGTD